MAQLSIQQAFNLALQHHQSGRVREAERIYRRILTIQPDQPDTLNNLGNVLRSTGRVQEAIDTYRRAIAVMPGFAEAHSNLGDALRAGRQFDDAVTACRHAIALRPDFAAAHLNLGNALAENRRIDDAIAAYGQAIALDPKFFGAQRALGNILLNEARFEEAISAYRDAIAINPNSPEIHSNLASVLHKTGRLEETIASCRQAISLDANLPEAHHTLALALLARGEFEPGWEELEWRWKCREFRSAERIFTQPRWDGRPLGGKTVLLHAEQGLGDTIQFIRYVPLVIARGGKAIVECASELIDLFRLTGWPCDFMARGEPLPSFDVHCPLLGLPHIFGTIPNQAPLNAEPDRVEQWKKEIISSSGALRVGLIWAGNPAFPGDRTRSTNLQQLGPLGSPKNVSFFSLQRGSAAEQASHPPAGLTLIDLGPYLTNFADTAAAMSLLDLIITTDTSGAHLAGALGRPVWLMLQFAADWRWMLDRDDSPWYPTMRLFRQTAAGDWAGVVSRVSAALSRLQPNFDEQAR